MNNLKPTSSLNGKSGEDSVRQEFTEHFKTVFTPNNSSVETRYKEEVNRILNAVNEKPSVPFIDFECIETCISRLKYNKAAGCDGTMTEHIAYGNKNSVHLCLAFNAFLRHCFYRLIFVLV